MPLLTEQATKIFKSR